MKLYRCLNKHKKVWEGFIKCCEKTFPNSFAVLLQLPAAQLSEVFEYAPKLQDNVIVHVSELTEDQGIVNNTHSPN